MAGPPSSSWLATMTAYRADLPLILKGSERGFQYRGSELYDPATGAFTPISDTDLAGSGATATRLNDGTVLTVGGSASANAALFDPISETFKSVAFAVPRNPLGNLQYHAATLLANGKVLIFGGATNNDDFAIDQAQLYDATSGTFQTTGSMLPARISHTATLLPSGSVLIAGGLSDASRVAGSRGIVQPRGRNL